MYSFVCIITVDAYEVLSDSAVFFNKENILDFFLHIKWLTNVFNHLIKTSWY